MTKSRWMRLGLQVVLVLAVLGILGLGFTYLEGQNVVQAQGAATATPGASPQATSAPAAATPAATTVPTTTSSIGNTFWQGLAAKLGVNVDTLKANALQVRKDMLDQAVKDGRATQDEVNRIKQQLTADALIAPINVGGPSVNPQQPTRQQPNPQLPNRGRGPNFGGRNFGVPNNGRFGNRALTSGQSLAVLEAAAKALNLQPADLVNQLSSGKTFADIATAQKVDQTTLKQAIVDARNAQIDRMVTDGLITQAEATALKARVTTSNLDLTRPQFFFP